jgi:endonuclease/exonuclease/phosphatase family metal-dependent hydrolase
VAPLVLGSAPPAAENATTLTVMSSNLRLGHGSTADVVDAVAAHDVDLLVLQEVTPKALAGLEADGIEAVLPHRTGQALSGAHGTMAFSRTPITDGERVPAETDSWAFSTAGLRVIAVHPPYPLSVGWATEQDALREAVERRAPDLVVGDFNAGLDHAPFRAILDAGLRDAAELTNAGWQPTWPTRGFEGIPIPASVAIDHVLVGERLTALTTTTVAVGRSDHLALVAEVAERA